MGVKCTNSKQDLDKMFLGIARIIREEVLRTLKYLGEQHQGPFRRGELDRPDG